MLSNIKRFWAIRDNRVQNIIDLVMNLNVSLDYPNSENSNDEKRYMKIYEEKILEIINKQ
jgi:hypothetical protein